MNTYNFLIMLCHDRLIHLNLDTKDAMFSEGLQRLAHQRLAAFFWVATKVLGAARVLLFYLLWSVEGLRGGSGDSSLACAGGSKPRAEGGRLLVMPQFLIDLSCWGPCAGLVCAEIDQAASFSPFVVPSSHPAPPDVENANKLTQVRATPGALQLSSHPFLIVSVWKCSGVEFLQLWETMGFPTESPVDLWETPSLNREHSPGGRPRDPLKRQRSVCGGYRRHIGAAFLGLARTFFWELVQQTKVFSMDFA